MPPTPRILKVVCRGTAELDAKNLFYKVIAPYIESLSRLGAIPRCNPTALTTRNVDRLRKSFEEDIAADLNDGDSRKCRLQLEVLHILYRALELFELQGCQVAFKFLSDIVGGDQTESGVRSELIQNEKFEDLRCQMTRMDANSGDVNDSTMKYKILKLADIVEKHLCSTVTVSRILVAVPTAAVCEEVNKMLASIPNLATSYVYDTTRYNKNVLKNFVESSDNCIVVITSAESLKGQHIPLAGISLAICLDVRKDVFRKPPYWQGSIYMLLSDVENKSFQGNEVLATSPRKPPATLKSALANQSSRGRKGFLTKDEQNYFDRHLKSSTKIVLPSRESAASSRSQAMNTVHLSLSRWRPWQSRLQKTYLVGHSADSQLLVDVLQLCDELTAKSEGVASKDDDDDGELAAHFRAEDVHFCAELSEAESDSYIGAGVDSFDLESINSLAISSEMDRYVLDNPEKIVNYLAELGLNELNELHPPSNHESNISESSRAESIDFPEAEGAPEQGHHIGTPHAVKRHHRLNESIKIDSSPLATTGRVPLASTPSAGPTAPRANFKVTPIASRVSKRQQSTPNSHVPGGSLMPDLESSCEASRLGLTALVNVVQKRKKQKNLQYFFPNKMDQQPQLSDIVEAIDSSSKEEILETKLEPTAGPSFRANIPHNLAEGAPEYKHAIRDANQDNTSRRTTRLERPMTLFEDEHNVESSESHEDLSRGSQRPEPTVNPTTCRSRELVEDDDDIFDDIAVEDFCPRDAEKEDYIDIASSDEDVQAVEKRESNAEKPSKKHEIANYSERATSAKIEQKRKIRSVFDALDEIDKEESLPTHPALLDIINNIPTRSKEVETIPEEVECKQVGNILPIELHDEIERTVNYDDDSDDLFDGVEEPEVESLKKSESRDVVLEELLRKADGQSLKPSVATVGESRGAFSSRQGVGSSTKKGFRKQKLKDIVETRDTSERAESSPESLKMSFSAPQMKAMKTARETRGTQGRSKSQKKYPAGKNRNTPIAERSLSQIFESRNIRIGKRARLGSDSSADSSPIQKRKKKPSSTDGRSPGKPAARKKAINQYFEDEAEVDSIDSVSEDEDERDQPNGYEIDSFVVDEDPIQQSQGMYLRLNCELSPRRKFREPSNPVPYEDCFSQRPPSGEDTYEEDSFVEQGSVSDVTLPDEVTIMQAPSEAPRRKKKTTRRVFICEESSEGDPSDSEKANRKSSPQSTNSSKRSDENPTKEAAGNPKSQSTSKSTATTEKNVIVVNMALLGILPDILIGLQRTFTASHIEPVDLTSIGDHPVDLYVGGLCIKLVTLEQLRTDEIKAQENLLRLKSVSENPVLLVMTPAGDQPASERLLKTIIAISDLNMRTFFVKNQVEVLMLLKCISKDLSRNEWLLEFLETEDLNRLLKIPHLNVLTGSALLKESLGKAQRVIQTGSVDGIRRTCNVSEQFAKMICVALRKS